MTYYIVATGKFVSLFFHALGWWKPEHLVEHYTDERISELQKGRFYTVSKLNLILFKTTSVLE